MDSLAMVNPHHPAMDSLHHLPMAMDNLKDPPLFTSIMMMMMVPHANSAVEIPTTSQEEKLGVWLSLGDAACSISQGSFAVYLALSMVVKMLS